MASIIKGYEYDIFVSYRQKDNKHDGWVTGFVNNLKGELESTFKEEVSVYFDINPHDGLLETHDVAESLKEKLKCLVFIPIVSRTYCDPKSFAWEYEFKAFVEQASQDQFGLKVKLPNGNVASRVLPVRIHDLDTADSKMCESVLGGVLRGVEFIFKSPGVNRPLLPKEENPQENQNHTSYRDQINKVANAAQEIISGMMSAESIEKKGFSETGTGKQETEELEAVIGRKKRRTRIVVGLLLIIFIGALFVFQLLGKKKSSVEQLEKSIAVLPFKNDSPQAGEENTPFVNGLMEEILINLQTIKEFRVPGRTSVEQFRDNTSKTIPEIARELDVNYIVEGSVQKYGDRFRLRVQLIRAKGKEAHLWAKSYEQAITGTDDIFKIQSEIAKAIATELKIVISPDAKQLIEQSPTENLDAYYAFLRGKDEYSNYFLLRKNIDALNRAEDFYNKALEYDPSYAQAYSGLAQIYWQKNYAKEYLNKDFMDSVLVLANIALKYDNNLAEAYSLRGDYYRVNTIYDKAIEEYKKTLDINPNYWQAYYGIGELHFYHLRDLENGLVNLEKALKLNHDPKLRPELLYSLSVCYAHIGFYDRSVALKKEALKIDRDSLRFYNSVRWSEVLNENYLKAIQLLEKCIILDPKQSSGYYRRLGDYYLLIGQKDTAIKCFQKFIAGLSELEETGLDTRHRVGFAYLLTGDSVMAEKYFELQKKYCEESIGLNRRYARNAAAYYDLACIYAYRGDKKNAYKNLHIYNDKIGETEVKSMLWWFKHDPFFNNIRNEPEFQVIFREIETKYNKTYERVRKRLVEENIL